MTSLWLATLARVPMVRQPGEAWLYNTCSDIQGGLVAQVSGRPLPVFLAERVFAPLGATLGTRRQAGRASGIMVDDVTTNSPERILRIERILPAARDRAFSAFVDPEQLSNWWGPTGFTVPKADLDVREGGRYLIEMQPSDGEPFWAYGEYREVEPPGRLVYTFEWDPPTPDDQQTLVTLALRPVDEGTRLVVEHGPFKTDERYTLHEAGWRDTLDRLEAWVADEPGRPRTD